MNIHVATRCAATQAFIINGRIQDVSYRMHALIGAIEVELTFGSSEAETEP